MDIATIIGIIAGFGLVVISIAAQEGAMWFLSITSVGIVFGGTLGATLVNFPMKDVMTVFKVMMKVFTSSNISYMETIDRLVSLAERARREGILAIERELETVEDEFLRSGIQYAVDGTEPEYIRAIMESELNNVEERHKLGQSIFIAMGTYAPAFGMIGTLIGLIQMLSQLEDPTKIGAGMATALVTTFYGALAANLFFLPMAGKLANRSKEEVLQKELILEGILSIQSGDNPRFVREKLLTFLSPTNRISTEQEEIT
ncbi:MotA/TolQ/ExbB proton channel family protein [bacterium]|nr:MotA/TolQ/ExbB proton channel family protein [bacterium]